MATSSHDAALQNANPDLLVGPEIPGNTGELPSPPAAPGETRLGVNHGAVIDNFPDKGLQLYVPVWSVMSVGDSVKVWLDALNVGTKFVVPGEVGQRVTTFIEARHLQPGPYTVKYSVERIGQTPLSSDETRIWVKLTRPGGQDQDGDTPGHSALQLTLPEDVINNGVDADAAAAGVPVTIEPYPDMSEKDNVRLSWGGWFVEHTVTETEVNNPIEIMVEESVILAAGDSGAEGLAVTYEVYDVVKNRSEDWAAEKRIVVDTGNSRLEAPFVDEAVNNVLDLDTLGGNPVTVQIVAVNRLLFMAQFMALLGTKLTATVEASLGKGALKGLAPLRADFTEGDKIFVKLTGTTADGEPLLYEAEPITIDRVGHIFEVPVPNAQIRRLAKTQAVFTYDLKDAANTLKAASKGAFINVIGETVRMAPPVARDAEQGAIDPELPQTTVQIPWDDSMQAGNVITLRWIGKKPDLGITDPVFAPHVISNREETNKYPINFTVPGTHLKQIEGGTLELYFTLEKDTGSGIVKSESAHTAQINVGAPRAELPAPVVAGVANGVLDPALPGTTLTVPVYTEMAVGDEVVFLWQGSLGGDVEDFITINSITVNKPVVFDLYQGDIAPNDGGTVDASYWVERVSGRTSNSDINHFNVGAAQSSQPVAPSVPGAEDGTLELDEVSDGAQVVIAPWEGMQVGDSVALTWLDDKGTPAYTANKNITGNGVGKEVIFAVTLEEVRKSVEGSVTVSYIITPLQGEDRVSVPLTFAVQDAPAAQLPAPTINEAVGSTLDPNAVLNGAHVRIHVDAQLNTGDEVTLTWAGQSGAGSVSPAQTATGPGEMVFDIAYATVIANDGHSVTLSYTVRRNAGAVEGPSPDAIYDVKTDLGAGKLKIMGARFNRSSYRASATPRRISAFDSTTGAAISAQWQYEGDADAWIQATTFRDTRPDLVLRVRTSDDIVALSPANIVGSGNDTTVTGDAALVAHRDVHDMVGWGNAAYGGQIPSTIITMDDVVEVSCTRSAYAARRVNGYVVVWGNPEEGGSFPAGENVPPGPVEGFTQGAAPTVADLVAISSNSMAFAGIKSSGNVVAWGSYEVAPPIVNPPLRNARNARAVESGGFVPPEIAVLTDITRVVGAGNAFAAIRATGQVVAWGSADAGGTVPNDIAGLTDIVEVSGNFTAFAAMRGNGRVVAWGTAANGGTVPTNIAALTDITELGSSTARAFSLIRATGQVMTWGDASYGGTVPEDITTLTDIVEVSATWQAFAARRGNGHVVAWGPATHGGAVTADIATLNDIVEVVGNAKAFAALRRNGTVVAWGDATVGGDTTAVVSELNNVQAIYANSQSFVALTSDGRVVTWGNASGGGDSSTVQSLLRGNVSYLATPAARGMALNARRLAEKKKHRGRTLVDWSQPVVEEAQDGFLDPGADPDRPIVTHVPPGTLKYLDKVSLYLNAKMIDYVVVNRNGPGAGLDFEIAASEFLPYSETSVAVWYGVVPAGEQQEQPSQELTLTISGGFEASAALDLSAHNYIVAEPKLPSTLPDFVHMTRTASWGVPPYSYSTSAETVASVDSSGKVTARANGTCDITSTDSTGATRQYSLTVSGINVVHFLTGNTDWAGMHAVCDAAGLAPVTLAQCKTLWTLYADDIPVTTYLGWLDYPFWTADSVGAGTYGTYNFGGTDVNENASSAEGSLRNQAIGVSCDAVQFAALGTWQANNQQ